MKKYALLLSLLTVFISLSAQTSRTWTGSTSTDWNTAGNWSPSGVPSSTDHIVLNTASGNQPLLDASRSITNITVSAGTLNLNGYTLTVTGTTSLTGGAINNGTASFNNTTTTFAGTSFGAIVNATVSNISFNGSTFNNKVTVSKSGSGANVSNGGNTFNDSLRISLTNGFMYMSHVSNDSYNGAIVLSSTGSSTGITFGDNTGNSTLATGKTISVGGSGFSTGVLTLKRFTQSGSTAQTLNVTGSASVVFGSNSTWNGKVAVTGPGIAFSGSTFNSKVIAIKNGSSTNISNGGNTFNDTLDLSLSSGFVYMAHVNNDSYNGHVLLSSTGSSTGIAFGESTGNATLASGKTIKAGASGFSVGTLTLKRFTQTGTTDQTLTLSGSASIIFGVNATWNGKVTATAPGVAFNGSTFNNEVIAIKNGSSTSVSNGGNTFNNTLDISLSNGMIYMAHVSNDSYNGNIIVSSTGSSSGITFGENSGNSTLASGKTISVGTGGFSAGSLTLKRFTQTGSTAQSLTLTGTATFATNNTSVFNGALTVSAPNVLLASTTFNTNLTVTKTGSSTNTWNGANTYNGDVSVTNTGSGYINLSSVASGGDTYNGNATFTKSGTGDIILAGSASTVTFKSNVMLNNISSTQFTGSQVALFNGSTSQTLSQSGGSLNFGRITINKSSNSLTLSAPLTVSTALTLTSGNIITTSTNLLNLADNATVSGASNSSYVQGPVSKTGNDAFTFPTGKASYYRPIGITAPASTATVFTAEYLNSAQALSTSTDTSVTNLSDCEYWTLTRSGSSSNVNVSLGWNAQSCNAATPANMRVVGYNGSQWINYGNSAYSGNSTVGTVTSNTNPAAYNAFTLSNKTCSYAATITPSGATSFCDGGSVTLTANTSKYYRWSNNATSNAITALATGNYIAIVRDSLGCVGRDTVSVVKWPKPVANAGVDTVMVAGDTLQLNASATSGTAPYSYSWSPATHLSSSTIANPLATPDTLTDYIVTVTDANGCNSKDTVRVWVGHLSFTMSADTANVGDTVLFTNTSTGFPPESLFKYKFGESVADSLPNERYAVNELSDTIAEKFINSYLHVIRLYALGKNNFVSKQLLIEPDPCTRCNTEIGCNLVCNGDFEEFLSDNSSDVGNIENACPWKNSLITTVAGETFPGADHFHTSYTGDTQAPNTIFSNTLGNGESNGYAGLHLSVFVGIGSGPQSIRHEYFFQQLKSPLLQNVKYRTRFFTKRTDKLCSPASSIGFVLSTDLSVFTDLNTSLMYTPNSTSIQYSSLVTDNTDFQPVESLVVGNGQEFITIGPWGSSLSDPDNCGFGNAIYYLVDDVSIVPEGVFFTCDLDRICNGSSPTYSVTSYYTDVEWYQNNTLVGTGNSYTISNINESTEIRVVGSISGCTVEDRIVVIVENCCSATKYLIDVEDDDDFDLNAMEDVVFSGTGNFTSNISSETYGYAYSTNYSRCYSSSNETVEIDKDLYIDGNFAFKNANVILYDDVKIIVKSGYTFRIIDSWLHGCKNMWQGIELQPGAKLIIDGSFSNNNCGSIIEDAKLAVKYNGQTGYNAGYISITNSELMNNYSNVNIRPNSGLAPSVTIYNAVFSTTRNLLYPYNTMSTSRSGIDIRCTAGSAQSVTIGDNGQGHNYFSNMQWGIMAQNTNLTLDNNRFENIHFSTADPANPTTVNTSNLPYALSSAVYTWSKGGIKLGAQSPYSLTVGTSSGTSVNNRFLDCENGIVAAGQVTPDIEYTHMEDIASRGIAVYGPIISQTGIGTISSVDIVHNRIETVNKTGIVVSGIRSVQANVNDNEVLNNDIKLGTGIYMSETFPRKFSSYRAFDNTVQYVKDGIKVLSVLKIPGSSAYYIGNNFVRIDSDNLGSNTGIGINIENNVKGYVFNNQIVGDDAGESKLKGFNFSMNANTNITCNDIEDVGHHIFINNNNQPAYLRNNEMSNGLVSLYYNGNAKTGPQGPTSSNYYWNAWYGSFDYGFTFNGSISSLSQPWVLGAATPPTAFNPQGGAWAVGSIFPFSGTFFDYNSGSSTQPVCIDGDPDLEECCVGDNTSWARMMINDTTFAQDTLANRWWSMYRAYEIIKEDSLLNSSTDTTIALFRNQNDTTNIGKLYTVYSLVANGELKDADYDNGTIVPTNTLEQNLVDFYDWYITKFDNLDGDSISFTATDTSYLYDLARSCPTTAGPSVYMARAVYTYINVGTVFFNTCEGGSTNSPRMAPVQNNALRQNNKFFFYPNPAQNIGYLSYSLGSYNKAAMHIYNMLGQPIEQKQLFKENNLIELSLDKYSNGLYLYTIITGGKNIYQGKFIVNR